MGIVVAGLEVVELGFGVVVVTAVAEGVDLGDFVGTGHVHDGAFTPGVVGIPGDGFAAPVGDSNNIPLQILPEIEGAFIVDHTADAVLVIVQRYQLVDAPGFPEDFGTVQNIGMLHAIDSLTGADAVTVIGVGNAVKGFQLPALFSR